MARVATDLSPERRVRAPEERASGRWARRVGLLGAGVLTLALALACAGSTSEDLAIVGAEQLLKNGDLPQAASEYERLWAENQDSVAVAVGYSYTQLLAGDIVGADTTLATIEPKAGEHVGEIRLRRALVALAARDLDRVGMLGLQSDLPEGKLLAAEVLLVDLQSEQAIALLREVAQMGGVVGETANTYLALVESGDQHKASLAEASALWALGDRAGATDAVKDSLKAMNEADPERDTLLLLWAGRAVVAGRPRVARSLLGDITFPPEGQRWRMDSTEAMIEIVEGKVDGGVAKLRAMRDDPDVPRAGIDDALATACALSRDPEVAAKLVEGVESPAAARCLAEVGAEGAAERVSQGPLRLFLEGQ